MNTSTTMQSHAEHYLEERRQLGYGSRTTGYALRSFARYVDGLDLDGPLTIEVMAAWARRAKTNDDIPATWAQAAWLSDQIPRQLSFKHTVQIWMAWQQRGGQTHDAVAIHTLLLLISEPRVGLRPGRIEPRVLKRRPKAFPLLTKPRPVAREEVRKNGHPKKQR